MVLPANQPKNDQKETASAQNTAESNQNLAATSKNEQKEAEIIKKYPFPKSEEGKDRIIRTCLEVIHSVLINKERSLYYEAKFS